MDESLRKAVLHRLSLLDQAAEQGDAGALLPLARTEIHRLTDGWRLLLTVHQPDDNGRCTACQGWPRHRRWPCRVWVMAHQHLIGEGLPHRERRIPLRNPFSRWRTAADPAIGPGGEPPRQHHLEPYGLPAPRIDEPTPETPGPGRPKHALRDGGARHALREDEG